MTRKITLEVDEDDYASVNEAIARRQMWRMMPEGQSNTPGAIVAEVCRGWMELHDSKPDRDDSGEEWKRS